MNTVKTLVTALMITLCSLSMAKAQNKPADAMNQEQLKKMLEDLGYDPKPADLSNNRIGYWIDFTFKGKSAQMFMQISPNEANIWSTVNLAVLNSEHQLDASKFIRLLQLNQKIGPCHFYVTPDGKMLCLTRAVFNKGLAAKELRAHIDSLINAATETSGDWDTMTWGKTPAAPQVKDMAPTAPQVKAMK